MGVDERTAKTPEVFEAKTSWALNEPSEVPVHEKENYRSVEGYEGQVEELARLHLSTLCGTHTFRR